MRARIKELLERAEKLDAVAVATLSPGGAELLRQLEFQISTFEKVTAWEAEALDFVKERGKALRSRDLLGYLKGAEASAQAHREKAKAISDSLEKAANEGRIPKVES